MNSKNKTAAFLIHEYSWNQSSLELHDVQPLFGGVKVLLPGWTHSQVLVSRIGPDGTETKYRLPLKWTEGEKQQLIRLCVAHDFLTIQPEERPGIPDEARPSLTLGNSKGESHTVAKWAGVPDARFDAIHHALLALAERTKDMQPIKPRFNAWQKGVTIAGVVAAVLLLLLPAYALARPLVAAQWPDQFGLLFFGLLLLAALLLIVMRGLAVLERKKARWNRTYTHLWVVGIVNLLFFVAVIGLFGLGETAVSLWRTDSVLAVNDERQLYAVVGYTAVFAAGFVLLAAGFVMPRLLNLIDERF
jgi:hypothetical protein